MKKFAYVKIGLEDGELTRVPPEHIQDFSYTRTISNAGNKFDITIYDKDAIEIEERLARLEKKELYFSYGWFDGKESIKYKCIIQQYQLNFNSEGAVLSLSGTSLGVLDHAKARKKVWVKEDGSAMSPSEIIEYIADDRGWLIGNIEETKPVLVKGEPKVFEQQDIPDTTFILDKLLDVESVYKDKSGYNLYFKDVEEGTEVYYEPVNYDQEPDDTFVYEWRTRSSRVIDFQPDYDGMTYLMLGSSDVKMRAVDADSNDMKYSESNLETNPNHVNAEEKFHNYEGVHQNLNASSSYQEEMDRETKSVFRRYNNLAYPATLTIEGQLDVTPDSTITVLVFLMNGELHHSSGTYYVKEIEDSISGGYMTSTLTLFRNSDKVGNEDIAGKKAGQG